MASHQEKTGRHLAGRYRDEAGKEARQALGEEG